MDSNGKVKGAFKNAKLEQLQEYFHENGDGILTNEAGLKISNDRRTLRAGRRGPTLLQDFHFYRKQSHFNRERIPEKVVHARGFGVHGEFECTKPMGHVTMAHFLQEAGRKTPVFVRFSTFIGNKGSKDTAQDVRGFATKFYTQEGNYDNLALSFGCFVISDAMKFLDFTHSVKPNPETNVPQATGAHDNFWDWVSSNQESAHFIMWLMSMRGRPRSWRMMEGYPINAFRFINDQGKSTFVRFIWKPVLGVHGLLLDEANIIGGVDPDFHRHDIIEAIDRGAYPEYELGVQLIPEEDEFKYDFDVLDDTKIWPEEVVPLEIIGKMTLKKVTENFFAEEEQSVYDPSNVVPGIDFSNDPVLQGRAFAYRDTEYYRQHTANLEEIPINRPIVETNFNVRGSYVKHRIDLDKKHFHNNTGAHNRPREATPEEGGYENYPGKVEGHITREAPSDSFNDFFSQARLFWNSMSPVEKDDLVRTFSFHVGKVKDRNIRQKTVDMFANVDQGLATKMATNIGVNPPQGTHVSSSQSSPVLSMQNQPYSEYTQKVAVLIGNGFPDEEVKAVLDLFDQKKVFYELVSENLGTVTGARGTQLEVNKTFIITYPVLYDSIYAVGGQANDQSKFDKKLVHFVNEAYKFYKPIGVATSADHCIQRMGNLAGVVFAKDNANFSNDFLSAIATQRFWERTQDMPNIAVERTPQPEVKRTLQPEMV